MSRSATHSMNCSSCTAKPSPSGLCFLTLHEDRQADSKPVVAEQHLRRPVRPAFGLPMTVVYLDQGQRTRNRPNWQDGQYDV